jgi:predicted lysophospholipase L1 biosynthesis ABC-type transport system permease subunit
MALLRNEDLPGSSLSWPRTLGLALALAVPFAAVTSWVMDSVWNGIGVLVFALAGLALLGGLLGGLAWLGARLLGWLPPSLPIVQLAQSSLRRRGVGLVFAMIALFTGIVALACGVVVTRNGQREMAARTISVNGPEISVLAPAEEQAAVVQAAAAAGLDASALSFTTAVESIVAADAVDGGAISPVLLGRNLPGEYMVSGAPWGSVPEGVYIFSPSSSAVGSEVVVTFWDGTTRTLPVVGGYTVNFATFRFNLGLLMPAELSQRLAPPDSVQLDLDTAPSEAAALTAQLGQALPQATVVDQVAYAARFVAVYRNLFILAVAMSGLALLAGALLVANTVSLAMLERRYEIGVLKAIGYTRGHLLASLSLEYGLVAAIATGAALVGVRGMLWVMGRANPLAGRLLVLSPDMAALVGLAGVGLILLTVALATWGPTGVSPAIVLNDRE